MAFPIGAALAGVGMSLAGDIANYASNERTNYYNRINTQETNALNYQIFQEGNDFNERMYTQYQSPQALRRQYEEAGLNPNLMMKGASAGSVASSVSPPNMQSPQVLPTSFDGLKSAGQNILSLAQAQNIQADTDAKNIDNTYRQMQQISDLREKASRFNKNSAEYKSIMKDIDLKSSDIHYRDEYNRLQNDNLRQALVVKRNQQVLLNNQAEYQRLVNEAFPDMNKRQLDLLNAQAYQAAQSGLAAGASIAQIKANIVKLYSEAANLNADTSNKEQSNDINKPQQSRSLDELNNRNTNRSYRILTDALDALFDHVLPVGKIFK